MSLNYLSSYNAGWRRIEKWTNENGYKLIDYRYAGAFYGPACWPRTEDTAVYRIKVEADAGPKTGWLFCSSNWWGREKETQILWDSDQPELLTDNFFIHQLRAGFMTLVLLASTSWLMISLSQHRTEIPLINWFFFSIPALVMFYFTISGLKIFFKKDLDF